MERRIPSLKRLIFCFLLISSFYTLYSQQIDQSERIRIALWAPLEAYPGTSEAVPVTDQVFAYPVKRLKETAPFLIEGMVYGWSFTYTPSDKMRSVTEIFEYKPATELGKASSDITYESPWIENNRLYCWIGFNRTQQMISLRKAWDSISYKKISGRGEGLLTDGFDGLQDACRESLKNAVREYVRSFTRNKPKEIIGSVLITGLPRISVKSGRYVVDLDFFLNVSRIVPYNYY